jgi:hypothetical protein
MQAAFAAKNRLARAAATALLIAGVLALAQNGRADTSYQVFHVVGRPLVVSLPETWNPMPTGPDLVFLAYSPNPNAYAGIADRFQVAPGFGALSRYALDSQRQFYATRYPTATVRHRTRALAIGTAEEVIVVVRARATDGTLRRQEIDSYWFQLRGRTYNFSCVFPTASAAVYVPICNSAAMSLRAG